MTKPVRYQEGYLYVHDEAWYGRYRERVRQIDGSIKLRQRATRLGSIEGCPRESQIKPLLAEQKLNAEKFSPESSLTLKEFGDKVYLPYIEEKRASTKKGYEEIWKNHICDRVGHIQLNPFRVRSGQTEQNRASAIRRLARRESTEYLRFLSSHHVRQRGALQ